MHSYCEEIDNGGACWPEAIKYQIRTNYTAGTTTEEIMSLGYTNKSDDEEERNYSVRLSTASVICRNVHYSDKNNTMYVDGVNKSIKKQVGCYRKRNVIKSAWMSSIFHLKRVTR